jgi:hypothetical protein
VKKGADVAKVNKLRKKLCAFCAFEVKKGADVAIVKRTNN